MAETEVTRPERIAETMAVTGAGRNGGTYSTTDGNGLMETSGKPGVTSIRQNTEVLSAVPYSVTSVPNQPS